MTLTASLAAFGALSVLLLDIDRFKEINDEHGHRRGDEVLQQVSECLSGRVRASDLLARVGGDEFAVLCPNTDPGAARHLADHLIDLVAAMPVLDQQQAADEGDQRQDGAQAHPPAGAALGVRALAGAGPLVPLLTPAPAGDVAR